MRAVIVAVVLLVSGCVSTVSDPVAVPEKRRVDCELIFPSQVPVSPHDVVVP